MSLHKVSSGIFHIESPADRFFSFVADDMSASASEFKEFDVDRGNKSLTFVLGGFPISKNYETIKTTVTVASKTKGSEVTWTFEFEKFSEDIDDPNFMLLLILNYLEQTEKKLKR